MTRYASFITRRARLIVIAAAALFVAAAALSSGVGDMFSTGGNEVPGSESSRAAALLDDSGEGSPNFIVEITEQAGLSTSSSSTAAEITAELRDAAGVIVIDSAWPDGAALDAAGALRSTDDTSGLILAHVEGSDSEVQKRSAELAETIRTRPPTDGLTVAVGGSGPARADLIETTDKDLLRAELIALPISMMVLLFVFRTPIAAALPLVVAAIAVVGTLAVMRVLVEYVEVSIFARSVATAIGLAMAVDMTLFLVSRFRELRPDAADATAATHDALTAAGPSMLFSALTTALSLAGLLAFSTPMLRSFAYAGTAVVLLALIGGVVVLPAVMVLLGDRLDRWAVRPIAAPRVGPGRWDRLARWVMRRPVLVGGATLVGLLIVASPILRLEPGLNDDRVLPESVESRQVMESVRNDFDGLESGTISVVFEDTGFDDTGFEDTGFEDTGFEDSADVDTYRESLASLPGVARVEAREGWLMVVPSVEPVSPEGRVLVDAIRATPSPTPVAVGGEAARFVDNTDHVEARLPFVVAVMILASAALLGLHFRSILIPVKAVVLNLLSLSAMFGAIVWIFQDGRFAGALGFTPTGLTDVTIPTLMFGIAFGLSMDYEVFLLSRIREEYRHSGDTVDATAKGLQRTGGVLSASAILMAIVFTAFATGSVAHLKVLGIGITLAVLVDAFVIRALLVPAFMAVAGPANWWPAKPAKAARSKLPEGRDRPFGPGERTGRHIGDPVTVA